MIRDDDADLVYRNENGKFDAVIDEIVEMHGGRPAGPRRHGLGREVRDARRRCSSGAASSTRCSTPSTTRRKRTIVAQAGRTGAVTIATNMAGRGTDILLGGNPAGLAAEILHKRGLNPAEVDKATYDEALAEAKAHHRRGPRAGRRGRRPAHHRHRAPRGAPHRQPAARPRRPPGRPGLVALLPVARGRPDEALRVATASPA